VRKIVKYKRIKKMEKEIAALKKEQLSIKKYLQENIKSDKELIKIVSKLRDDIKELETIDTNGTELPS
jgi:hypothetical protein